MKYNTITAAKNAAMEDRSVHLLATPENCAGGVVLPVHEPLELTESTPPKGILNTQLYSSAVFTASLIVNCRLPFANNFDETTVPLILPPSTCTSSPRTYGTGLSNTKVPLGAYKVKM